MATATNRSSTTIDADRVAALACDADLARRAGRYDEATLGFARALEDAEATLPADHPALVQVLNGIGVLGKYAGDHDGAHNAYQRALTIEEQRIELRPHAVATLLHNIAGLDHARRRFEVAESTARRGVELRRSIEPVDVDAIARDEGALAAILVDVGQLDEAILLARRAEEVLTDTAGPDDHDAIAAVAVLAAALHKIGDRHGAERAYSRAVTAKELTLGADHPELAPTLNNFGVLLAKSAPLDAIELYTRALRILEAAALPNHPYQARIEANLARLKNEPPG